MAQRLFSAAVFLLAVGCVKPPPPGPTPEELAQSKQLIDAAVAKVAPLEEERRVGLAAAVGKVVARPDLGACPIEIDMANPLKPNNGGFDLERMKRQTAAIERVSLDVYTPEYLPKAPSPLVSAFKSWIAGASQRRPADVKKRLERSEAPGYWNWDLVVVEEVSAKAAAAADGTYEGGYFFGTAYLWSFTEKKVLCVADIRARLPETLKYRTLQGASEEEKARDLALTGNTTLSYLVLEQAIANLELAGPRLGAAGLAE